MITKEQHIIYWKNSAEEDLETAHVLLQGKRYGFCLFSLHLYIEKLLKALWVKESVTNTPPFTHDLVRLADECELALTPEQADFLYIITSWNIRGRYPDYSTALHQSATPAYVQGQLEKIKILAAWLKEKV